NLSSTKLINILINEIKYLYEKGPHKGFMIEIVNNNVYHLKLKFGHTFFDSKSSLYSELALDQQCVQLEIKLDHQLYPFYPPSVWVISPRFKNNLNRTISCMNILLKDWNLTFNLETIITNFKTLRNNGAQIDFPYRSYETLEHDLIKLELLMSFTYSQTCTVKATKTVPIRGTGYGYDGLRSWDFASVSKTKDEINRDFHKCIK